MADISHARERERETNGSRTLLEYLALLTKASDLVLKLLHQFCGLVLEAPEDGTWNEGGARVE